MVHKALVDTFPFLHDIPRAERKAMVGQGRVVSVPAQQFICLEGDQCQALPFVVDGRARVYKSSDSGREITLYRLESGSSCILTASCILSTQPFPAFAVTETPVTAFMVPAPVFRDWLARYSVWREYTFGLLADRLAQVMALVEEVAFERMDVRLGSYLIAASQAQPILYTTHEAIAVELGSSREVVSRLLKNFEHKQFIALGRGQIRVINPQAMHAFLKI